MSRRFLLSILRPGLNPRRGGASSILHDLPAPSNSLLVHHHHQQRQKNPKSFPSRSLSRRPYASSTAPPPSKPFVLEKPDKFRPPSHPQHLNRKPPRVYPGPPLSQPEREAQKTKRYPHMFPNEGTRMHWFLTNKWIHVWISLGTLSFLAFISLTQYFILTSPYSHLIPPLNSLPGHPIRYVKEWFGVIRMHTEYISEKTAESRRQNILDAQKRRLYRRAHGLEDLDAPEEQGIDIRGLVEWDDGLTNKERREGGRKIRPVTLKGMEKLEHGPSVGDPFDASPIATTNDGAGSAAFAAAVTEGPLERGGEDEEAVPPPKKKKVKRWLGIWE